MDTLFCMLWKNKKMISINQSKTLVKSVTGTNKQFLINYFFGYLLIKLFNTYGIITLNYFFGKKMRVEGL
ncbi:MAG: hypothetical protein ABI416_19975 [Ginsengibacter sp.]